MSRKQVIGAPLVIDGRELSLSRAIRAGDFGDPRRGFRFYHRAGADA